MASTGSSSAPSWRWPDSVPGDSSRSSEAHRRVPGSFEEDAAPYKPAQPTQTRTRTQRPTQNSNTKNPSPESKTWPSRTCRICLEVVPPTIHPPSEALPTFLQSRKPRVTYISEDPELGRLFRPCKCKGSSRYVHEGCLQTWRHADPSFSSRNYWTCPTCGFRYRLQRMSWGRFISSTAMQLGLTVLIFFIAVFGLGFVADPIINLYLDPYDTLASSLGSNGEPLFPEDLERRGWTEHLIKGLASLGLLGFVKVFFALSPWQWWNLRNSGIVGGRAGAVTGRDRLASVSWVVVIVGVLTFLWTVYKGVRAWARRTLEHASEKVMDIPLDDDEEELVDENMEASQGPVRDPFDDKQPEPAQEPSKNSVESEDHSDTESWATVGSAASDTPESRATS